MSPPRPVPVSAPPRVAGLLREAPDARLRVLHRGPLAAYVDAGGWALGLVDPASSRPPNSLVLAPGEVAALALEDVRTRAGRLVVDGRAVAVGRLHDVGVPRVDGCAGGPDPDVAALVGRGEGLTPEGDDLLCGWLAAHRATGTPSDGTDARVRAHLARTTLLSAGLLEAALLGEAPPLLAAWLRARGGPDERDRATALAALGHSSGRALLHGARCALAHLPLTHPSASTRPSSTGAAA